MIIRKSSLSLPGFKEIQTNPLPILRDINPHLSVDYDRTIPDFIAEGFGNHCGFRVLPYKMQNHYQRSDEAVELETIILENEHLRATFLPAYGGRLYSLYNKSLKKELLSVNPCFQPANLAQRNAWFSGGIEWNMGHYGHTYLTCDPVFFGVCETEEGISFLRLYEYERVSKLYYQIDFHLHDDWTYLASYTTIINPNQEAIPTYYWSNTAVSELNKARVFSSTDNVVYVKPSLNEHGQVINTMAYGQLPYLDGIDGDVSYPRNFDRSNEYFYQIDQDEPYPYEAVAYEDGSFFYECSSMPLRYRKMFCWGTHQGGDKWQNFLSHGAKDKYVEIQAGLFPTQLHSSKIDGDTSLNFFQIFGLTDKLAAAKIHSDLNTASAYIKDQIFSLHSLRSLEELKNMLNENAQLTIKEHLSYGNGWGALEKYRRQIDHQPIKAPPMSFPSDSMTSEQAYWFALINQEVEQLDIDLNTVELTYLTDPEWLPYIDQIINQLPIPYESLLIHKALILSESLQAQQALALLMEHFSNDKSVLYKRTLGAILAKLGKSTQGLSFYDQAYHSLGDVTIEHFYSDFLDEYLALLLQEEQLDRVLEIHRQLSDREDLITEEMYLSIGMAAARRHEWAIVDQALSLSPQRIREGNNTLCELWFMKEAHLRQMGLETCRQTLTPPDHIDFRMM